MTAEPVLNDLVPIPGVWARLEHVEERLFEASLSEDDFLTKVAQHLLQAGGKRFRPLLALLAAEFGPGGDDRPVEAGVAVELIHVGSLYHDDVIDEADTRHGAASVNSNWTNTVAILAGDFLMARASEVAAARLGQESVRLLARTYAELVEGQTRELQLVGDLDHTGRGLLAGDRGQDRQFDSNLGPAGGDGIGCHRLGCRGGEHVGLGVGARVPDDRRCPRPCGDRGVDRETGRL